MSIEWSSRAFASKRAVRLFLRALAVRRLTLAKLDHEMSDHSRLPYLVQLFHDILGGSPLDISCTRQNDPLKTSNFFFRE